MVFGFFSKSSSGISNPLKDCYDCQPKISLDKRTFYGNMNFGVNNYLRSDVGWDIFDDKYLLWNEYRELSCSVKAIMKGNRGRIPKKGTGLAQRRDELVNRMKEIELESKVLGFYL